jgi:Tol biopolymer transport system component
LTQWFDRSGKPFGRIGEGSDLVKDNSYYQSISPDGRRVALGAFQSPTADLWLVDIARDIASRFTFDGASDFNPAWSPDSSQLLYSSNRSGFFNIYLQSVTSPGKERRLAEAASHQYPTDWSKDGTIILTNVDPKTQGDIWTMPAAGGPQVPLLATSFNEYAARRSPNGEWLAYTSDESGRSEVYVQRYPSGRDRTRASTQGGSHPQWRADGRELFYLGADRRLMVVSTALSPTLTVGRPVKVFDVPVDTSLGSIHANHFAVSADGQRFLLGVSGINQSNSTVVLNWMQALTPPITR